MNGIAFKTFRTLKELGAYAFKKQNMYIQLISILSRTDTSLKVRFMHPVTYRHCFAWLPKKHIQFIDNLKIKIPTWLWKNIKATL